MMESEKEKILKMPSRLKLRVIGQNEAIDSVSNAILRSRAGLSDEKRPIGSFIFLGSTGVGKTELAKALAEFLFDDENAMIRIDMSEYMESHAVSRLIGAPPGYVGYDEGGQLTEAVHRRPYSVLLFDEIEKAHPDVFNILLQVLDDGRLTDNKGRTVNFKNTVIIMTSNLGAHFIAEQLQRTAKPNIIEEIKKDLMRLLQQKMRPEFLNRIDDIIVFHPLSREDLEKIVDIQFNRFIEKLKKKDIIVVLSTNAKKYLSDKGYDAVFGARPLKRLIQNEVVNFLSIKLLDGSIDSGSEILIDYIAEKITIVKVNTNIKSVA
jgi:ATP-dependent Clp protease ATP-binding subunit ClpB